VLAQQQLDELSASESFVELRCALRLSRLNQIVF
jgi:hypothetical protein